MPSTEQKQPSSNKQSLGSHFGAAFGSSSGPMEKYNNYKSEKIGRFFCHLKPFNDNAETMC